VIEDVEGIHEELCPELFGDRERLRHRQVRIEPSRTVVTIATEVADLATVRQAERTRNRARQTARIRSAAWRDQDTLVRPRV
jgi:hypothetical protein